MTSGSNSSKVSKAQIMANFSTTSFWNWYKHWLVDHEFVDIDVFVCLLFVYSWGFYLGGGGERSWYVSYIAIWFSPTAS